MTASALRGACRCEGRRTYRVARSWMISSAERSPRRHLRSKDRSSDGADVRRVTPTVSRIVAAHMTAAARYRGGGRRGAADKRSGVLRLKANDLVRHSLHRCGCYWRSQRRLSFCCWRTHRALHRYACFYPLPRGIDGAFCGGPQQAFDHLPRAHRVSAYVAGRIDLGSRQRWIAVAAGGPSLRRSPRTFC
jgi:hypothetical protein